MASSSGSKICRHLGLRLAIRQCSRTKHHFRTAGPATQA